MSRQPEQGQWVIANIYSGEIAPETARYADLDEAGQTLMELVQQGRLQEGDYEVRPAPAAENVAARLPPERC